MKRFFESWYGPGNAVLVLCGDFDPEDAFRRVDRFFGEIPPDMTPERTQVPAPAEGAKAVVKLSDTVSVPRVYMMYHAPSFQSPEYEASVGLSTLLAGGALFAPVPGSRIRSESGGGRTRARVAPGKRRDFLGGRDGPARCRRAHPTGGDGGDDLEPRRRRDRTDGAFRRAEPSPAPTAAVARERGGDEPAPWRTRPFCAEILNT